MKTFHLPLDSKRSHKEKKYFSTVQLKLPKLRFGPTSPLHYSPKPSIPHFKPCIFLPASPKTHVQMTNSTFLDDLIKRHKSLSPIRLNEEFLHSKKPEIFLRWSKLQATGQYPESRSGAILLPFKKTFFLLSGERSDPVSDLFCLPYSSLIWEKKRINTSEAPTAFRCTVSVAYKDYIIVYGGYDYYDGRLNIRSCSSLLYYFSTLNQTWKSYKSNGNVPEPRRNHSGCLLGDSLIIFSGQNSCGNYLQDTQILDLKTLAWLTFDLKGTLPASRIKSSLTSIYPVHLQHSPGFSIFSRSESDEHPYNGVYLFGGKGENGEIFNELFILRNKSSGKKTRFRVLYWSVAEVGQGPIGRYDHSAGFIGKFYIIFSGRNDTLGVAALNDLHLFNVHEQKWQNTVIHGEVPSPRFGAACAVMDSKLIIFGGMSLQGFVSGAIFELETSQKKLNDFLNTEC